jgi:hypothetical protein
VKRRRPKAAGVCAGWSSVLVTCRWEFDAQKKAPGCGSGGFMIFAGLS